MPPMRNIKTTWRAREEHRKAQHIAIIGGGLAGLTAAYELQKIAIARDIPLHISIIERSARFGGQIETDHFSDENLRYEAGAELISGGHYHVLKLCKELGVPVTDFYEGYAQAKNLFDIDGKLYSQEQFEHAFAPLARAVAEDEDAALRREQVKGRVLPRIDWSFREADQFDKMSIREYLKKKQRQLKTQGIEVKDWVIEAVCIAYGGEIGHKADHVSALNFVTMLDSAQIRSGKTAGIEVPGEADAILHMEHGNESLIEALKAAIETNAAHVPCDFVTNVSVDEINQLYDTSSHRRFTLGGKSEAISPSPLYDAVIACVPPKRLNRIAGWDDAIYNVGKNIHTASIIDELQEGVLTKVSIAVKNPQELLKQINYGKPFQGIIYSDSIVQTAWVSPQPSNAGTSGVITCYLAGKQPLHNGELGKACKEALLKLVNRTRFDQGFALFKEEDIFVDEPAVTTHWDKNARDAFVAPGRNQFLDLCHIDQHHGNFSIAGSFVPDIVITDMPDGTHDIDIQVGYMNNAVAAGKSSARAIIDELQRQTQLAH